MLKELAPLRLRPWGAGAGRLAQVDAVRELLRRTEYARDKFADLKRLEDAEFVGRGVKRIPERLEDARAFLAENLLRPNSFIQLVFFCFERRELIDEFRTDRAGNIGGTGGGWRRASARDHERRRAEQQDHEQDDEDLVEPAAHAAKD